MSFDELFRKDRPNKLLRITPSRLVAAGERLTVQCRLFRS